MRQRTGLFLILLGLVLAIGTTFLVIRIGRQAIEAGRGEIRQVNVVTTKLDIADRAVITADALMVKPFPADFAPVGALGRIDEVVGKVANGFIAKDQVVVAGQLAAARPPDHLSYRVPPGRVAVWLPMPELLAGANVLRPGDHVDILLTICLGILDPNQAGGSSPQTSCGQSAQTASTQTTLQNVEVFRIGEQELSSLISAGGPPAAQPAPAGQAKPGAASTGGQGGPPPAQSGPGARQQAIGFLVDHQDAVTIKFVKDSGGIIDLVTRSEEEQQVVRTEAVTLDSVVDRFRFRVPQTVTR